VAEVLQPEEYPAEWPQLPKAKLLQKQAERMKMSDKFKKVRQTTRFVNGPNSVGVEMKPSSLTGQDTTGVNDGSKNSTLVTYVADAWNWGAEIFCECEVRYIEKDGKDEGYRVYFAWHGRNRGLFKANLHDDLMWVHAKKAVFLGAGAIASTEILLRSKAMGLKMSDMVGQNMSGNGDMLAFG
jgi:choline dehydrogenase-like flavoprotein